MSAGGPAATTEPGLLPVGHVLGDRYRIVRHLSRGDALDVYEVWSDERQVSCVAKLIRPERRHQARVRRRLRREGHLLRAFTHPHLVRAYETLREPELAVILETLPGPSLDDLVYRPRRLKGEEVAMLGVHLCSALSYLHIRGVLHLDLKPDNVIVNFGLAKLIDLSLARPPGPVRRGLGTSDYLAPEQATGGEASEATDVWGLGATLYEAATARLPFAPRDAAEEAASRAGRYVQLTRGPVPVLRLRRTLPPELVAVIHACLEPDPRCRPALAEAFAVLRAVSGAVGPPAPATG